MLKSTLISLIFLSLFSSHLALARSLFYAHIRICICTHSRARAHASCHVTGCNCKPRRHAPRSTSASTLVSTRQSRRRRYERPNDTIHPTHDTNSHVPARPTHTTRRTATCRDNLSRQAPHCSTCGRGKRARHSTAVHASGFPAKCSRRKRRGRKWRSRRQKQQQRKRRRLGHHSDRGL
jgi:hypothetical protein